MYIFFISGTETLFSVIILKYSCKKETSPVTDTDHSSYTGSEEVKMKKKSKHKPNQKFDIVWSHTSCFTVYILGRDKGYTVKYSPLPVGVPEGEARENS